MAADALNDAGTETGEAPFRKRLMEALSRASVDELQSFLSANGDDIDFSPVRGPETGLVMVRGKIGGGGSPFNLGEVTVTRASIRLANGIVGHAHVLGGARKRAQLAAVVDALAQMPEHAARAGFLLQRLEAGEAEQKAALKAETAATRVDFFTLVRGED